MQGWPKTTITTQASKTPPVGQQPDLETLQLPHRQARRDWATDRPETPSPVPSAMPERLIRQGNGDGLSRQLIDSGT